MLDSWLRSRSEKTGRLKVLLVETDIYNDPLMTSLSRFTPNLIGFSVIECLAKDYLTRLMSTSGLRPIYYYLKIIRI